MADVFLSYSQTDRVRAEQVARALTVVGWQVWWDVDLYAGAGFREEIAAQLAAAKCVVVMWSAASIRSHFVIDEADEGRKRGVLVQARIEKVQPPFGFRGLQWADLSHWRGDAEAEDFTGLTRGIRRHAPLHEERRSPPPDETRPPFKTSSMWRVFQERFTQLGPDLCAELRTDTTDGSETWKLTGASATIRDAFTELAEGAGELLLQSPKASARLKASRPELDETDPFRRWLQFAKWGGAVFHRATVVAVENREVYVDYIDRVALASANACARCYAYETNA